MSGGGRDRTPPPTNEVIEGDGAAQRLDEPVGDIEPDPLRVVRLDRPPRGLADPSQLRGSTLGKTAIIPPLAHLFPDAHGDSDSSRSQKGQENSSIGESNRFRYACNVSTAAGKADSSPPQSKHAAKRKHGAGTISDQQMRAFQLFLEKWIELHCTDREGNPWPQRAIAQSLGITQNEVTRWLSDKARPGLPRAIHLYHRTRTTIERMFGLE